MKHRRFVHRDGEPLNYPERLFSQFRLWRRWNNIDHDPRIRVNGRVISSKERKTKLEELMNKQLLPFVDNLRSLRLIDRCPASLDKTTIPEMIASIVVGTAGTNYRGQSPPGHEGDLSDGTEVKSTTRIYGNIDSLLRVRVESESRLIVLDDEDFEWASSDSTRDFMKNNHSSVQFLEEHEGRLIGLDAYWKIKKQDPIISDNMILEIKGFSTKGEDSAFGTEIDDIDIGDEYFIMLRQTRGHFNVGKKNEDELLNVLTRDLIFTSLSYDPRGNVSLLVLDMDIGEEKARRVIRLLDIDEGGYTQYQPYSFEDIDYRFRRTNPVELPVFSPRNHRNSCPVIGDKAIQSKKEKWAKKIRSSPYFSLNSGDWHNSIYCLNPKVLAYGRQTANGFKIEYWNPRDSWKSSTRLDQHVPRILRKISKKRTSDLRVKTIPLDEPSPENLASYFFSKVVIPYYRGLMGFSRMCNMSANMGFSKIGERMVCLLMGLHGSGTDARGADIIENDGSYSEVKTATGRFGDYSGTRHKTPPYHLGDDIEKIQSWRRLFFVRIIDRKQISGEGKMHMKVLVPTHSTMRKLHSHVEEYFQLDPSYDDLEYMSQDFEDDFGQAAANRRLDFQPVAIFVEGEDPSYSDHPPLPFPILLKWTWEPPQDDMADSDWRDVRKIEKNDVAEGFADFFNINVPL